MAKVFNKYRLPPKAKNLYDTQQLLRGNIENALFEKGNDVEELLFRVDSFALWKSLLHKKYSDVSDELIDEIFIDLWLSIDFACIGLYKQAHVCLRASLEMTLRLVYFSRHPVEYNWWSQGKSEDYKDKNSRGEDFSYFKKLEAFKDFEKIAKTLKKAEPKLISKISLEYSQLSKYVHSNKDRFQTGKKITPKYVVGDFNKWQKHFELVMTYMNTVLMLGFSEEVKSFRLDKQKILLKNISIPNYKSFLRRVLLIKFKGKI